MDVRADVFLHLLFHERGNSLSIAREVCCGQKSAYNILERWTASGIAEKTDRGYVLARRDDWRRMLGQSGDIGYLNWPMVFRVLDRLLLVVGGSMGGDEYLLSSQFRDFTPEIRAVARSVGVALPSEATLPGARLAVPFAEAVIVLVSSLA